MKINQALSQFPSSAINNSREIIRSKLRKFHEKPSDALAQEIEHLSGIDTDWSDADNGMHFTDEDYNNQVDEDKLLNN